MDSEDSAQISEKILALTPEDGESVGNKTLRERVESALGFPVSEDDYYAAREPLITGRLLSKGQGRGGSVRRIVELSDEPPTLHRESMDQQPASGRSALSVAILREVYISDLASGGHARIELDGPFTEDDQETLVTALRRAFLDFRTKVLSQPTPTDEIDIEEQDAPHPAYDEVAEHLIENALTRGHYAREGTAVDDLVREVVGALVDGSRRTARIIIERYGLAGQEPATLECVGNGLGVTRARVQQIESKVLPRLRHTYGERARRVIDAWSTPLWDDLNEGSRFVAAQDLQRLADDPSWVSNGVGFVLSLAYGDEKASASRESLLAQWAQRSLQPYCPFGVSGWVHPDIDIEVSLRPLESWVSGLSEGRAFPTALAPLVGLAGHRYEYATTVLQAHPERTIFAGYLCNGRRAGAVVERAVRVHHLLKSDGFGGRWTTLYDTWVQYRTRFSDDCSLNDLRVAITDARGAPHLFVVNACKEVTAVGPTDALKAPSLRPRFEAPELEPSEGTVHGTLRKLLADRPPASFSEVEQQTSISLGNIQPTLSQRAEFSQPAPYLYWNVDRTLQLDAVRPSDLDLVEDDALAYMLARVAGEAGALYPLWTRYFEQELCVRARDGSWPVLPELLHVCEPGSWAVPVEEKIRWLGIKENLAATPAIPAFPTINRLPSADRMLTLLLECKRQGSITWVGFNSVIQARDPLSRSAGVFMALLCRVGAVVPSHGSDWNGLHLPGNRFNSLQELLSDEYAGKGRLDWSTGSCAALLRSALDSPRRDGWFGGQRWDTLLERLCRPLLVVENSSTSALEESEDAISGAPTPVTDPDGAGGQDPLYNEADGVFGHAATVQEIESLLGSDDADAGGVHGESVELDSLAARQAPGSAQSAPDEPLSPLGDLVARAHLIGEDAMRAQFQLYLQLWNGQGALENRESARYWLEKAAGAGDVPAMRTLGRLMVDGHVDADKPDSCRIGYVYLKQASKQGDSYARYRMGMAQLRGDGVYPNFNRGLQMLRAAARMGSAKAAYRVAVEVYRKLRKLPADAQTYLVQAANAGYEPAALMLTQIKSSARVTLPD